MSECAGLEIGPCGREKANRFIHFKFAATENIGEDEAVVTERETVPEPLLLTLLSGLAVSLIFYRLVANLHNGNKNHSTFMDLHSGSGRLLFLSIVKNILRD